MDVGSARGRSYNGGMKTMFQMTIPLDDIPPPFKDSAANRNYDLLQNTAYCRDGKQRVPTPERLAVLELAESVEKHRLRRQQQLLLDIAQRCKEQDIWTLSSGITRKCNLATFDNKYMKDMRFNSTNTILFKTWDTPNDIPMPPTKKPKEVRTETESPRLTERSNTHFPKRKVIRRPPKHFALSNLPQLQFGYSKGLLVKPPDADKKQTLMEECKINGPIQLGLYQPKNDQLQPLILPSIRYVGIDKDNVETYVNSKQMDVVLGPRGKSMHGTFAPLAAPEKKEMKNPRSSPDLKMIGNAPKSVIDSTPAPPDPTPRVVLTKRDNTDAVDNIVNKSPSENPVNIPSDTAALS